MRIDSHQHFWQYDPVRESWITDEMRVIRRDFMPHDLEPVLQQNGLDGCVVVQSDQSEEHNDFLLELANNNAFIKGIVGWVDLRAEDIHDRLRHYKQFESIKGFRHVLQGEEDRSLMLRPAFMKGIAALKDFGFTYDILIFPDQLQYIPEFVAAHPDQKFVIDHIAKPYIKDKKIEEWKRDMQAVAKHKNVYCKISGMVTEADFKNWKKEDFTPYIDAVVEAFGTSRIMFGSDWPVCLVAASYEEMIGIVKEYFASFSADEQEKIFGGNAQQFYNLK
ncbi:amidohydrolase family protein [Aridibaculum aurantiacum]|uniref:amidohydrolase family protein n=1 Tax=Aridibaculum aurantiacum TaxID=2810307 RepID=UPI001A95D783|nr:amidohydrolase family protein [Aridibaculum aurantiacum]